MSFLNPVTGSLSEPDESCPPTYSVTPYFLKTRFNIILPSEPTFPLMLSPTKIYSYLIYPMRTTSSVTSNHWLPFRTNYKISPVALPFTLLFCLSTMSTDSCWQRFKSCRPPIPDVPRRLCSVLRVTSGYVLTVGI